jgi:nucleotide-binding universal stress UspA family protein
LRLLGLTAVNVDRFTIIDSAREDGVFYRSLSMIKDIIVNLEHQVERDPARDFAISIAEMCDTHIAGVAFAYSPDFPDYTMMVLPSDILEQMVAESERSARAAIERFDEAARRSLISAEHRLLRTIGAEAPAMLSILARRFDLSVFMQSEPGRVDNDDMIETALFQSGRPLIVVPYIQRDGLNLERVVCCWDGSRAAARAFNDALPLLAKATSVHLLIVLNEKTNTENKEVRGVEIATHLARHDVKVQIETVPGPDIDVTDSILSYVADNSGTLVVMGGYGHAKLREVILGGVTREMLKSMTVPVFMSH